MDEEKIFKNLQDFQPQIPQFQIRSTNWRPIIYSLIILSTKYCEDRFFKNI